MSYVFCFLIINACFRHVYACLQENSVLDQFLAVQCQISGGVFRHTDHDHSLRQDSTIAICSSRYFGDSNGRGQRNRCCQSLNTAGRWLKTPLADGCNGIGVALFKELQLPVGKCQTFEQRMFRLQYIYAQVSGVDGRSP